MTDGLVPRELRDAIADLLDERLSDYQSFPTSVRDADAVVAVIEAHTERIEPLSPKFFRFLSEPKS